ncbi:hypothetical protein VSR68_07910 [Paraburkholderia phymatum]|uniref:hypothetical protein n=1 Tax=Paraburkholderia phymatum TaxID=148447 RepID=UPI003177A793
MARGSGLFMCVVIASALASMSVQAQQQIRIQSGTYGANCGATPGNVTRDLASRCNSHATCRYIVNAKLDLKPHPSCAADFVAEWSCDHREFHRAMLSAGAGNGSSLMITCVPSTGAGK